MLFISWPHAIQANGRTLVRALKTDIEDCLRNEGLSPGDGRPQAVFLDETSSPTKRWDPAIRTALCRSAATLVLVLPTYFQSPVCAQEWAISEALHLRRLGSSAESAFLLLPYYGNPNQQHFVEFMPPAARELNFLKSFDRKKLVRGRLDFTKLKSWHELLDEILREMRRIALMLVRNPPDWVADHKLVSSPIPLLWNPSEGTGTSLEPFPVFRVEGKAA